MPRARRYALVFAAIAPLAVAGCGTDGPVDAISNLNPFKQEEQKVPGNRRSVLEGADPVAAVTGKPAVIGAPTALSGWPQPGGNAANDPGNVAAGSAGGSAWSTDAGRASASGTFGFSSSAGIRVSARPVAAGGVVYSYDPEGNVTATAASNGGRVFRVNVRPQGEGDAVNGGGVAVDGGRVYAATGFGEVVALDAGSGGVVWRAKLDAPARGAPTAAAGKVVAVTQAGTVFALDAATGAKAWTASSDGSGAGLLGTSSPAVAGNLVIAPTNSGAILALDLASGAEKWRGTVTGGSRIDAVTGLRDASASPVVHAGVVYATGVGGRLVALKADTGEVVWDQAIGSAHTPVVSGEAVFLVDLSDRLVAFDRTRGTVLWATQLPSASGKRRVTWAGPLLANGRLWAVSVDGKIASVDARDGSSGPVGAIGLEGAIAPIAVDGRIVVLGGDGRLTALN
ncbi:PQQ-binding-like beta-propeller repeat protein [Oharaeibacter diazotrophicus]|uniref:Outer membrane protein assembly factor BamB n=2 Tax=Oharaeibacter diazotrophicus TaxID=1920512 RepID=A0A4R6RL00_9HYPH|nr:PQQ-binding-like beta-propeller repeat protein [Oharaeibacter diazotrophicus]TDP86775.1 outer membrane protein assembly factor BamB [Oharaeibacter diazotrophicus]BBE71282.1 outer membrane protein assembly factor BamB precursor [Pleomorphomonas sp. SM30]GLS78037.1 hypothetical protein GCM10007904_33740 [Oharaeibacter diazotrophicus]